MSDVFVTPYPAPALRCDDLQIRLALAQLGYSSAVETYVASADAFVKAWWEKSQVFRSDNPMLLDAAEALGVVSQVPAIIELATTFPKAR